LFYLVLSVFMMFSVSLYYCIKFALVIVRMQEVIEVSLDEIEAKYNKISEISEIPVFFDSPEIKRLLIEINDVKNIVYEISYNLANINISEDKEEEDKES
jgi:hypothetical protein